MDPQTVVLNKKKNNTIINNNNNNTEKVENIKKYCNIASRKFYKHTEFQSYLSGDLMFNN